MCEAMNGKKWRDDALIGHGLMNLSLWSNKNQTKQ